MHNDPHTITATMPAKMRDPFEFPKPAVVKVEPKAEPKPPAAIVTPSDVGLTLSGTIIGPRSSVAQISGKTYTAGQKIEIKDPKTTMRAAFKVMEVHPRRVVLQSGSQRFELSLPEPGKSDKIEFQHPRPK